MFSQYTVEELYEAFGGEDNYSIFYGALDAWFDTEDALLEVINRKGSLPMLSNMGLMVALRTQQNAVHKISKVLGGEISLISCEAGRRIRKLQSRVLHPEYNNENVSTFFPVSSSNHEGFEVAFYGDENSMGTFVKYDDILEDHEAVITGIEERILQSAEEVEFKMYQENPRDTLIGGQLINRGDNRYRAFKQKCEELMPPPVRLNIDFGSSTKKVKR